MFRMRQSHSDPYDYIYLGPDGRPMSFTEWSEKRWEYLKVRGKPVPPKSRKR